MQNQVVILRRVLEVKFTKYCTCAAESPAQAQQYSRLWTTFSVILELETYMLEAYLGKYIIFAYLKVLDFMFLDFFGKDRHRKIMKSLVKILDTRSISTRKHEWNFANMVPVYTTKQNRNSGNAGSIERDQ